VPNLYVQLDLQMFAQEKTEAATPQKRREARKKGQVAKSMELPGAFILFFSFLFLYLFGGFFKERIYKLFSLAFNDYMLLSLTEENVLTFFSMIMYEGFILLSPIFIMTMVIAVFGNYIQFGFLMSGDPLMMKLEKLSPIEGAKRIFSVRSVVEFFKSILKLLIIGLVAYFTLWGEKEQIVALSKIPLEGILAYSSHLILMLGIKVGIILVVLAILDYIYQRFEFEKSLRMSKQDIKDEFKKTEGDPLIKAKIREKQRRMALQRMMQEVPKADVVITNPTHFAVALQYDTANMEAPTVIAKGQDYMALKIKEIAKQNDIITMENKPLARALYAQVDIGQTIPNDMFQAVAEVLAYVYKVKRKA
jgi:flagellar biosynthetic protein FlhB